MMISNKAPSFVNTLVPKVENIQAKLGKKILIFNKKEFEMNLKDRHAMIQAIAREKKQTCIVTGLKNGQELIQGPRLTEILFEQVK